MNPQFIYTAAAVLFILAAIVIIIRDEKIDREKQADLNHAFANGADAFWFNLQMRLPQRGDYYDPAMNVAPRYARKNPYVTSRSMHESNLHMAWERGYNQARQIHEKQIASRHAHQV